MLRFSQSLRANTSCLANVELILVIDDDDHSYDSLTFEGLNVKKVTVPHGLAMGELNLAGYQACSGRYMMLLNDDVIIRTSGWDEIVCGVLRGHPDDVVLVHVNDKIFQSRLCTFPLVTRLYCELAGGICLPGYQRYRIDDHIYNVFNLLSVLGYNRIVYLPDVEFEHLNYVTDERGMVEYQPDPKIHELDTELFDATLPARKDLAVELTKIIKRHRRREEQEVCTNLLKPICDSVSLRKPEFIRTSSSSIKMHSEQVRVTVGVVSADIQSSMARACLHAIKSFTNNFDLIILDNNRGPGFNHSREMNRLLSVCRTDYLILMDDDVFVEPGWVNGLLFGMGANVGVVTPLHKSSDGKLSYAGVVMSPDHSGNHTHALAVYQRPFPIQTLCSAIMLIDMNKCGHLRLDESYSKYFLDIDYGLRVWESGFQVVCSPEVVVTHIGGGTLDWSTKESSKLFEEQRRHFVSTWIDTGRYQALERSALWNNAPEIRTILSIPQNVAQFLKTDCTDLDSSDALVRAHDFGKQLQKFPAVANWVSHRVEIELCRKRPDFTRSEDRKAAALIGQFGYPILIETVESWAIYLWRGAYYAVPGREPFDKDFAANGKYRSVDRQDLLTAFILCRLDLGPLVDDQSNIDLGNPVLIEEGYKGFNLIQSDRIYALAQRDGAFDPECAARGEYLLHGETVEAVKAKIDAPLLIEEGYKGFNLIQSDRIYALAQRDGAFDPERAARGEYFLYGATTEAVKAKIDAPLLIDKGYKGFNLIQSDRIYALAQRDGPFDPESAARGAYPIQAETVEAIKTAIDGQRDIALDPEWAQGESHLSQCETVKVTVLSLFKRNIRSVIRISQRRFGPITLAGLIGRRRATPRS